MPLRARCPLLTTALAAATLALPGCGGRESRAPEPPGPQVVARLYGTYISRHRGVPPRTADELKAFAHKLAPDELKNIGIDAANVDSLFVSPRDGKPLVFRDPARYGGKAGPQTVVLYEAEGKGGKRMVVFSLGQVEDVAADRFKQLVPEGS